MVAPGIWIKLQYEFELKLQLYGFLFSCEFKLGWFELYQPYKMVKHTQKIHRQQAANCLSVFDRFVGLTLKILSSAPFSRFWETFLCSTVFCKKMCFFCIQRLTLLSTVSILYKISIQIYLTLSCLKNGSEGLHSTLTATESHRTWK